MKKGFFLLLIALLLPSVQANELLNINFRQKEEVSYLELLFSGDTEVEANKFHIPDGKQIIIDLVDTTAGQRVIRAFDTSEFSGSVVFVSAYSKPDKRGDIRIAIQLRDNVRSILKRAPNRLILEIENRFGVFSQNKLTEGKAFERTKVVKQEEIERLQVPRSDSVEDILQNLTLSGRKKYIGEKISINAKDLAVSEVLDMIAEASGFNLIQTKEVKSLPTTALNLTDTPWDQVLDTILSLYKLVAKKNGIILMVTTLEKATEEQKRDIAAKKQARGQEPLVTKVFPISYSDTKDLSDILTGYLTPERGKISIDKRTSSLIVRDTAGVLEKMIKIVDVLDTQTPQVLIEAKIIEVLEDYSKEIGLKDGFNFGYDPVGSLGSSTSPVGGAITPGSDGGPGFSFSSAPNTGDGARSLFGLSIARFGRVTGLNFNLQLLENESKVKIVSAPKVVAKNNQKATLSAGDSVSFATSTTTDGTSTGGFSEATAELKLEVTPHVTNEGSISLDIDVKKEQFGTVPAPGAPPNKSSRQATSSILVENGSTAVIGGLYQYEERENHSGVPFLKDVPLIGWLFRTAHNPSTSKKDLIIFITPRIINQEEAGITKI